MSDFQNWNNNNNQNNKNKPRKWNGLIIWFFLLLVLNLYLIVNNVIFWSLENKLKNLYNENQKTYSEIQYYKKILNWQK